jgi:hypothetical protein
MQQHYQARQQLLPLQQQQQCHCCQPQQPLLLQQLPPMQLLHLLLLLLLSLPVPRVQGLKLPLPELMPGPACVPGLVRFEAVPLLLLLLLCWRRLLLPGQC